MIKGLWIYCPSLMFSKTCTFPYFYILPHLFSFSNNFPPPPHSPVFFFLFQILPPTPFPQTSSSVRAVPSSAVFCGNAMVITTPNFSLNFFSFFDMLPSAGKWEEHPEKSLSWYQLLLKFSLMFSTIISTTSCCYLRGLVYCL